MLRAGDLILFQGDSITDGGRDRGKDGARVAVEERGSDLGRGYAMMVAAQLGADRPADHFTCRNLGISGNRIVDLYARMREHGWALGPQVLSILIGVNDTWHEHMYPPGQGVDVPRYGRMYRQLLEDTRQRLPEVRLVLCEPFVLPCGVVQPAWRTEIDQRRALVAELARDFSAVLVPLQAAFDQALAQAPAEHWAADGVHPSPAGHLLMARTWLAAVAGASATGR